MRGKQTIKTRDMKKKKATPAAPLYTVLGSVNKQSELKIRVIPLTRAKQKGSVWIYPAGDGNKSIPVVDLNKVNACEEKSIYSYRGYCFKSRVNTLTQLIKSIHAGQTLVKVATKASAPVIKVPAVKKLASAPVVIPKESKQPVAITSASGKLMSKLDQADIDAVAAVLAGHKEKFELIYKRYYPIILQKFSSNLKFNKELAEDLTADLFVKVYNSLHKYTVKYTFNSWISRVAKNLLVDYVRKQKLDTVSMDAGASSERMRNDGEDSLRIEMRDNGILNPEESILSLEKEAYVKAAIELLDENCRKAITMLFYEDKSYVDIAEEMNMPLGTLKNIIFRAKIKLKAMMESDKKVLAVVMN
jgi:RNA polymerase sigma-70 factor (ECF subfamily)